MVRKKWRIRAHQIFQSTIILLCVIIVACGLMLFIYPPHVTPHGNAQMLAKKTSNVTVRIPILIYHYVEYVKDARDTIRASLNITPNVFEAQIKTLKDDGYIFVTPSYIAMALQETITPENKVVVLSFDDGYLDFYTDVYPILVRQQVRAIVYVVPNFLDRPNFMYTWQLRDIAKSPYVEVGAHTMNHTMLRGLDYDSATQEIIQSRIVLENMLHVPIHSFAYPYGAFDDEARQIVEKAGFTSAVGTLSNSVQTPANRYSLYRLRPGERTGQALLNFLK